MRYRITYRPELHREPEVVEADTVTEESGTQLVLRGTALVIGQPREVVVRRLRTDDVLSVSEVQSRASRPGGAEPPGCG